MPYVSLSTWCNNRRLRSKQNKIDPLIECSRAEQSSVGPNFCIAILIKWAGATNASRYKENQKAQLLYGLKSWKDHLRERPLIHLFKKLGNKD